MNAKGYLGIPRELGYWITFLAEALPLRSVGTFVELLFGSMLTSAGFVTEAYLAIPMRNHWTSYYKWLQEGKWSWLGLARQFVRLMLKALKTDVIHLVIDDTVMLRASKKAPGSQVHHQHGNKPNLADYVRGQCWVSLAWVVCSGKRSIALPLLSRLVPAAGNTGKLVAAQVLVRGIHRLLEGKKIRVLVDSWYMKGVFIQAMLKRGFDVIGQVRIDTQLFDEPPRRKKGQRGRPRKYGRKYTPKRIAHLKRTVVTLPLYGKEQTVRYCSKVLMAYFLQGRKVRVVWCEFQREGGQWTKSRLLLSTDVDLTPEQIIEIYAERWSIESMFHQLKQAWGLKEAWQQSRQTLHRWVHLTQVGYGLLQLLSLLDSASVAQLCQHSPWRKDNPTTAGQIRKGLVMIFRHVPVRQWWNRTCRKFEPPDGWKNERTGQKAANSGF